MLCRFSVSLKHVALPPFLEQGYDYTSACELAGLKKPSQEKNKLLPPLSSKKEYARQERIRDYLESLYN